MPSLAYLHSLPAVTSATADTRQGPLLDQALAQVGFVPNMYAHMVQVPAVLSTYLHGYGLFRKDSRFTPAEQEVAFLAISMANGCDYCAAAHSMIAQKVSKVPEDVLFAIRHRQSIPDARLAALHQMATALVQRHGRPQPETVQSFLQAGFEERDVLWLILAAAVKTLSNFTNHALGTPLDERFTGHALPPSPEPLR